MTAGELRQRLLFDSRGSTSSNSPAGDGYGNFESDWSQQLSRMARVTPVPGSEEVIAQRLSGVTPFYLRVRYDKGTKLIQTGWRARDENSPPTIYNITSVVNIDERKFYIDITAYTGKAIG